MSDEILTLINDFAIAYNKAGAGLEYFGKFESDDDEIDLDAAIYRMCESILTKGAIEAVKQFGFDFEHIEQEGGGEGGTEYCYGVFKINGKYYKAEYSYYSYNGHEYDDIKSTIEEVFPVERLVTFYEPKQ